MSAVLLAGCGNGAFADSSSAANTGESGDEELTEVLESQSESFARETGKPILPAENKQAAACKWYKKSLELMEQLAGETDEPVDQKSLSLCRERLRAVYK